MHSQNFFLCMGRERSLIPRIYSAIEIPKFASEIKMQMLIYNAHPRQKKGSNKKKRDLPQALYPFLCYHEKGHCVK